MYESTLITISATSRSKIITTQGRRGDNRVREVGRGGRRYKWIGGGRIHHRRRIHKWESSNVMLRYVGYGGR